MSQWEIIRQHGLYDAISVYYTQFPVDVRGEISEWLEKNVFESRLNPEDLTHLPYLQGFMNQMLDLLKGRIMQIDGIDNQSLSYKKSLADSCVQISNHYNNDPAGLFRTLKYCLEQEKTEILRLQAQNDSTSSKGGVIQIHQNITMTAKRIGNLKPHFQAISKTIEDLGCTRQLVARLLEMIDASHMEPNGTQQRDQMQQQLACWQEEITTNKGLVHYQVLHALGGLNGVFQEIDLIMNYLLHELNVWHIEQRKAANGYPMSKNLDRIDELVTENINLILQANRLLVETESLLLNEVIHANDPYPEDIFQQQHFLKGKVKELLEVNVTKGFVVERQPFQIIRSKTTDIKPAMKLRLLGGALLNPNGATTVTVSIIPENQAKAVYQSSSHKPISPLNLTNDKKSMKSENGKYSVELSGMMFLAKLPRRSKGRQSSETEHQFVAEEKWCFLFKGLFHIPGSGHSFNIQRMSLPVSITCHPTQDAAAAGAILWDNAFANETRELFEVTKEVPCDELLDVLDKTFFATSRRGLSEGNKRFLKVKLLRNTSSDTVTWDQFFKDHLEGALKKGSTPVSFWEWLFAILKMCEKNDDPKKSRENLHFQKHWEDGRIEGFISREDMENKLRESSYPGIFMMRFSCTILGAVTLNYYSDQYERVNKIEPYTLKELKQVPLHPLSNRINQKEHLQYLYPDIPKAVAFPDESSSDLGSRSGLFGMNYIRRSLHEIEEIIQENSRQSQYSYQSNSPSSSRSPSLVLTPRSYGFYTGYSPSSDSRESH